MTQYQLRATRLCRRQFTPDNGSPANSVKRDIRSVISQGNEEDEPGSPTHLAFDQLEAIDLSFNLTITPGQNQAAWTA